VKLYSYIDIGKYLGCVKIFPLGGVRGGAIRCGKVLASGTKMFPVGGVKGAQGLLM